jgi:DNA-binding HxlR family transcriptional regulator
VNSQGRLIRDALLGLLRFDEFQRNLGIARKVLAERSDHFRLEEVEFVPGPGRGSR